MNCSKCGEPLPDGARFCSNCGNATQSKEINQTNYDKAPSLTNQYNSGQPQVYDQPHIDYAQYQAGRGYNQQQQWQTDQTYSSSTRPSQRASISSNSGSRRKIYNASIPFYKKWWTWGITAASLIILIILLIPKGENKTNGDLDAAPTAPIETQSVSAEPVKESSVISEKAVETPIPEVIPTPEPEMDTVAAVEPSIPKIMGEIVNVSEDVNVRAEPSKDSDILGKANLGEQYEILEENAQQEWHKISFNAQEGYIKTDYIAVVQNADNASPSSIEQTPTSEEAIPETGIRKDFKEAMDSYEAFYNEYFDIMEKYKKNPTDLSLLGDYTKFLTKANDMNEEFADWESKDLSEEELKYYLDVNTRITKKLIDIAQ